MADKTLTTITAGIKPDGTESLLVKQGADSRRLTLRNVAELGATVITDATTARTLIASDAGKYIRFTNVAAITVTLDTAVMAQGDEVVFEQGAAGVITVVAGAGFTLTSRGSLVSSNGAGAVVGLKYTGTTTATLVGDRV